ncbi:MAG: Ig-like domain-containing protein, partial [Oscillospiraceae bacterium]|nr:Ig-like domain-containing protein [Oscillospiraceae bacterium]
NNAVATVDSEGNVTAVALGEADITASIAEIEKNLQPFVGDTEMFRIIVKDSDTSIEKISD